MGHRVSNLPTNPHKLQGSRFFVGRDGATLGRRQTNTIAFSHESGGTVMGIDASISGEHARIVYDEDGDFLHIMDGTPTKVRAFVFCVGRSPKSSSGAYLWFCSPSAFSRPGIRARAYRIARLCLVNEQSYRRRLRVPPVLHQRTLCRGFGLFRLCGSRHE